ncbi:MAG: tetratricopeptide repeat protein, partial [Streptosporangiaceae bacterium]
LTSRNNLASAYQAGRQAEAIPLLERTLADSEQVLGDTHPSTLTSRNNLASAYQDAGRLAEAERLRGGT